MHISPTLERPGGAFPQTQWELVEAAAQPDSGGNALGRVLEIYLPFLEMHLASRFSLPPEQAKDLLQGFVLDKVMQKSLFRSADRARGKFRNFLVRSLSNYVIEQLRWDGARKRAATNMTVPLDELPESNVNAMQAGDLDGFDIAWARGLLTETLQGMKEECQAAGRMDLWGVFEARLLAPLVEAAPPAAYEDLMQEFGFASAVQTANALITAKRMFSRQLRALVGKYVEGEAAIQSEISQLKEILVQAGTEMEDGG